MTDYSPRSSYESDNVPWSKAVARRAVRAMIGQECGHAMKFHKICRTKC